MSAAALNPTLLDCRYNEDTVGRSIAGWVMSREYLSYVNYDANLPSREVLHYTERSNLLADSVTVPCQLA